MTRVGGTGREATCEISWEPRTVPRTGDETLSDLGFQFHGLAVSLWKRLQAALILWSPLRGKMIPSCSSLLLSFLGRRPCRHFLVM